MIPTRPFAVAPWHIGTDPSIFPWLREAFDVTEVLVHTEGGHKTDKAEAFIMPNGGFTLERQVLTAAEEYGHKIIVTPDNKLGNGRLEDGGSLTGAGRYGRGYTEGNMGRCLQRILQWPEPMKEPIIAWQQRNEPPPMSVSFDVQFLIQWAVTIRAQGWKIIVEPRQARACVEVGRLDLFDVIDPHPLFFTAEDAGHIVRQLKVQFPGKEIWATELLPDLAADTCEIAKAVIEAGATAYSGFVGNTIDFPDLNRTPWNFRKPPRPTWTLRNNAGLTVSGREWEELRGMNQDTEPPPPEPGVDVPGAISDLRKATAKWEAMKIALTDEPGPAFQRQSEPGETTLKNENMHENMLDALEKLGGA